METGKQNSEKEREKNKTENVLKKVKRQVSLVKKSAPAEVSVDEALKHLFFVSSLFGIHLIAKGDDGEYKSCWIRVVPFLLHFTLSVLSAFVMLAGYWALNWPYWFIVMTSPYLMTFVYVPYVCVQTFKYRNDMASYMKIIGNMATKPPIGFYFHLILLGIFSFFYSSCIVSLIPEGKWRFMAPAIYSGGFYCLLVDFYISSFVLVLENEIVKLDKEVMEEIVWTDATSSILARKWLNLKREVWMHNKIFRETVYYRLALFTLQSLSFLFVFSNFRMSDDCVVLLVPSVIPFFETSVRFYLFCIYGENMAAKCSALTNTVIEVSQKGKLDKVAQRKVSTLLTRMEARPLYVEVWGFGKLGSNAFIKLLGMIITYLVMTLEFRPANDSHLVEESCPEEILYYQKCLKSNTINQTSYF